MQGGTAYLDPYCAAECYSLCKSSAKYKAVLVLWPPEDQIANQGIGMFWPQYAELTDGRNRCEG